MTSRPIKFERKLYFIWNPIKSFINNTTLKVGLFIFVATLACATVYCLKEGVSSTLLSSISNSVASLISVMSRSVVTC